MYYIEYKDGIETDFKNLKSFIEDKINKEIEFIKEDSDYCQDQEITNLNNKLIEKLQIIKNNNNKLIVFNRLNLLNDIFKVLKEFDKYAYWNSFKLYKNDKLILSNYQDQEG